MKLYDHQEEGVRHFIKYKEGAANFCDMGVGKSAIAIVAAQRIGFQRILIICPNTLKFNWEKELILWNGHPDADLVHAPYVLDGAKTKRLRILNEAMRVHLHGACTAVIVNYEMVVSLQKELSAYDPQLIICDESHRIKNHKSKCAKAIKAIKTHCRWIMTGTPTPQGPLDVWSQYDWIRPGHLPTNYYAFRNRYANYYTGAGFPKLVSYKNLDHLHDLVAEYSFRKLKSECLSLPDKVFQTVDVQLDDKNLRRYSDMVRHFVAEVEGEVFSAQNAMVKMGKLQQITSGSVKPDDVPEWKEIGREKIDATLEILEGIPGEKVVIFCRFKEDVRRLEEAITKAGRKALVLSGDVSTGDRAARVERFQMVDESSVLVCNIAVGGVGLNLTAASYVIFYSGTYSLGDYKQACDRCHRIGQSRKVTYIHLVCPHTIDSYIMSIVEKKEKLADIITGDDFKRMAMGG